MNEHWRKWEPIKGLASKYSMQYLEDNENGFKIILLDNMDSTRKLLVYLKNGVYSYRFVKNGGKKVMLNMLAQNHGANFFEDWTFFKIENSHYLTWLSTESCNISDGLNLQHFVLITSNGMIEFIIGIDPQVEFIQKP